MKLQRKLIGITSISIDKVKWVLLISAVCFSSKVFSQPIQQYHPASFNDQEYAILRQTIGQRKQIPAAYEKQILIALSYFPELKDIQINFRVKHSRTPLSSRPSWLSIIRNNRHRTYIITISDSSISALAPILFGKMDFNAQVGVLGHEISHVADFNSKTTVGLLRIGLGNLSKKFLDGFEYRTDSICIAHGLGYQLLSWSMFVRKALHSPNWDGADNIMKPEDRERYMNPPTIRRQMRKMDYYRL